MFLTNHNGKEYSFHDDHMTIDGVALDYGKMTDIAHKAGETPAIVFTYEGQRITLPYNKEEYKTILPYFIRANKLNPEEEAAEAAVVNEGAPADAEAQAEPEFVYEPEESAEPEAPADAEAQAEPEFVYEPEDTVEPEVPAEPEYVAEPEVPAEPEYVAEPEVPAESEYVAEPEVPAEPEYVAEPEVPAEQEYVAEPEVPVEPEASDDLGATTKKTGLAGSLKNISKTKLIIGAAIIAAMILAIILAIVFAGKSVDGIDGGVKTKSVKTEAGDTIKVTVIDDDVDVDEYADSYYESRFKDGDTVHWIHNKAKNQTILFADQDGTVLICVYEHVDGDEEDPSLLGSGALEETWILYPETGDVVKI